ncbi:DUF4129 domain-containing protein [Arcticibacter tournemirensis]|uniref:DUF4129 domain-containing protein n=1 Tax=Arcticibacter tournemirensis TaxID=699437 RepID=A0A5M9H3T3_9SPHI|nr:DUF4129 domain-containing protein [Arcticibacter tournemirensis]KAA8481562.1 DUF4129 domain-containing protein [Arcticibacter tournemirensis]
MKTGKILFILFLLFAMIVPGIQAGTVLTVKKDSAGAVVKKAPQTLRRDEMHLHVREFSKEALNAYRRDKDFNYDEKGGDTSVSWWERFWGWVWEQFRKIRLSAVPGSATFWKGFFIVAFSAVIIFIIVKLTGMDITLLFKGRPKVVEVPYRESLENIHEISFDEEIENAIGNHDFRLATRLLYLKTLKRLSDSGRIKWELDKTNSAYINELKHPVQKKRFGMLTREFEYVWYGGFPVDLPVFERIRNTFLDFNREVYR